MLSQNRRFASTMFNGTYRAFVPQSVIFARIETANNKGASELSICLENCARAYTDVIMGAMASKITSLTIVYSTVYSGADKRKQQSSASLAFVWGSHRRPVKSPHKWLVTRKMLPFDDVIMGWNAIFLSQSVAVCIRVRDSKVRNILVV